MVVSLAGAYRASPAKQGERQEYIDLFSLYRESRQNKQCFHNQYMDTCLLHATAWSGFNDFGLPELGQVPEWNTVSD